MVSMESELDLAPGGLADEASGAAPGGSAAGGSKRGVPCLEIIFLDLPIVAVLVGVLVGVVNVVSLFCVLFYVVVVIVIV